MNDKKLIIAFDVDDTLIVPSCATGLDIDTPNYENIAIYKWFQSQGHTMIIWSGGGMDYARRWAEKLGLNPDEIRIKENLMNSNWESSVDICFDDCQVNLAKVNIKVSRVNNRISRKEWNIHKNI